MSLICNPTRAFVSLIVHFERSSTRSARAIASRDALAKTLKRRDRHRHRRRCVAARASRGVGMERTHLNVIERPLSEQFHFLSRRHRDRARRVKTERRVGRRATCRARVAVRVVSSLAARHGGDVSNARAWAPRTTTRRSTVTDGARWLERRSRKRFVHRVVRSSRRDAARRRTTPRDDRRRGRTRDGRDARVTRDATTRLTANIIAQHTAKELASKAAAALTNKGGGKSGKADRLGGAAGHAKFKCPVCAQGAPSEKTAVAHGDSKHAKLPFVFADWTDAHAASGGVTTQGAAVKGGKEKTVHELQKTAAGRAELARRQAEKERIANLQF